MDKLINWMFHFLASNAERELKSPGSNPVEVMSEKLVLQQELDQWPITFHSFMEEHKQDLENCKIDKDSATMVAMIHCGTKALFHISISVGGNNSIDVDYHFKEILWMAEKMMARQGIAGKRPRSFSFETGLVAPLWLLAMNSQDSNMRSKATSILKTWPRREGVWDGQKVAEVIEKAQMSVESNHLCHQKPEITASKLNSSAPGTEDFYACLIKNPWSRNA